MRMVAEYVFSGGWQDCGAMKTGRKVRGEEGPDSERADELRAVEEGTVVAGAGEENVYDIRKENWPEDRDGA